MSPKLWDDFKPKNDFMYQLCLTPLRSSYCHVNGSIVEKKHLILIAHIHNTQRRNIYKEAITYIYSKCS